MRAGSGDPLVSSPAGRFQGYRDAGVLAFRGIRYGQQPVRFQPPVAAPAGRDTVRAIALAPSAPQAGQRQQPHSEDSLFLNVWTPDAGGRRPVLLYFHGGAYSGGTVSEPLVDGRLLAARGDVVVVTVNHRLNALGYLYLARLDPAFPSSGNAGQLDLILALQWVRRNIGAFGGDAANVTLFGQSGGGAKIATLMAMPQADGLFHKAITMSGQQVTASGPQNATRRAAAFLEKLRATAAEAASLPVERLVAALAAVDPVLGGAVYFGPVMDMLHLPRHPFYPDADPRSRHIPMLLGNTVAETRAFFPASHRLLQGLDFGNLAARLGPELKVDMHPEWVVAQFRARYPALSPQEIFWLATTTGRSWRGQVIEAERRAEAGVPAFVYQLDYRQAGHGDDIALAFGTGPASDRAMSDRLMAAFVAFARTGNPGWAPHSLARRETMIFDTTSRVEGNPRAFERDLFARAPYVQPGS